MIVLDLSCEQGHPFEGWFRSAEDFAGQCERGQVHCPVCGSNVVLRQPSAPKLVSVRSKNPPPAPKEVDPASAAQQIAALLRAMAAGAEDVGKRFPEEARKIHYGDAEHRSVRGQASRAQVEELLDEGIGVLPVPPDSDLH